MSRPTIFIIYDPTNRKYFFNPTWTRYAEDAYEYADARTARQRLRELEQKLGHGLELVVAESRWITSK